MVKEVCFNLWYWLNERQQIVAIAAKGYILDGSEDQKGKALLERSGEDYRQVAALALEEPIHYSELQERGVEEVYAPEFERIRLGLPAKVPFPEDKLFWATALYDFGQGYVPVVIGDGYIGERP